MGGIFGEYNIEESSQSHIRRGYKWRKKRIFL